MTPSHYATLSRMKRALGDDQKNLRKEQILAQAAELMNTRDFETLTLTEVAQGLDLVKGTLYRYFPTKEALVLEVLERELELWLQQLEVRLPTGQELGYPELTRQLSGILAQRPLLVRLFSIVHVVLEKNVTLQRLIDFKTRTAKVLIKAATIIENACPALQGHGKETVLALYELSIGIGHLTNRSDLVNQALEAPGLGVFRLDFDSHLQQTLAWTIRGMITQD